MGPSPVYYPLRFGIIIGDGHISDLQNSVIEQGV